VKTFRKSFLFFFATTLLFFFPPLSLPLRVLKMRQAHNSSARLSTLSLAPLTPTLLGDRALPTRRYLFTLVNKTTPFLQFCPFSFSPVLLPEAFPSICLVAAKMYTEQHTFSRQNYPRFPDPFSDPFPRPQCFPRYLLLSRITRVFGKEPFLRARFPPISLHLKLALCVSLNRSAPLPLLVPIGRLVDRLPVFRPLYSVTRHLVMARVFFISLFIW